MPERDVRRTPGVRLTYDDLLRMPDDGARHELIDGELFATPAPNTPHQTISMNLSRLIASYLHTHRTGRVFAAPFDILLGGSTVMEPDLVFVSNDRVATRLKQAQLVGAPELVIEILSPSTASRDLIDKRVVYERSDVLEYWLVDPDRRDVTVQRRSPDSPTFDQTIRFDQQTDVIVSDLLPGLECPLAAVFDQVE